MKEKTIKEYKRRLRLILKSKLNGKNKVTAINVWAVAVFRYGAGIIQWKESELKDVDRKSRKTMTMYGALHPKSNVDRLYIKRKEGGRGLMSVEGCVRGEENSLGFYIASSEEKLVRGVAAAGIINTEDVVRSEEFKKQKAQELKQSWSEKKMHGQFIRELPGEVDKDRTWQWLSTSDLKIGTEALLCAAQEQAIRTNYVKYQIDKTSDSPLCRLCGKKGESVQHLISGCEKLAQKEYKRRHDTVAKKIHWDLCKKNGLEHTERWYEHVPEGAIENEEVKVLWDINIQCDNVIEARRPDIIVIYKKERKGIIIDIAVPADNNNNNSRVTKDQLLIDKTVFADCKRKQKNLAMAWMDYKKAYDMVPRSWIIDSLKMTQVAENIITFLRKSMVNWNTELTSCGETLGLVDIKRGIFQGDSLSFRIFTVCMIPLTKILQDAKAGYTLGDVKINHLFFMDDLKVYGKDKAETASLVSTVQLISQDIGTEFGIKKCGVVVLKRGKLCQSEGVKLINGQTIKEVNDEGYKYLGILELDKFKERKMKEIFRTEYLRRFKLVMKSQLNGKNKIKAANTWAVSLMRYGAGTNKWNKEELQGIDKKSRKIMTTNKELHLRSEDARIYVPRMKGVGGLISCECCVRREENNLSWYVRNSEEVLLRKVGDSNVVNISEAVDPKKYKVNEVGETENEWMQKRMHGQYVREKEGIDWDRTWQWIAKGDLKGCTEALICSAQEQTLRKKIIRDFILITQQNALCVRT